ncbi:MAG: double-strand break repair helicase AddA, partial [Bauldia sp.]|nr:double-strand break repair helicase AddA [Bauldia sp.]
MNTPVDAKTAETQASASHPASSAWVSANAGSGKTFVLSRRVIRLLLAGTDPSRILCLTFTKAAAAEMAKRVFHELGEWATLSDAALAERIAEIEGEVPDATLVAEARRLFARALDTPGGLKIQTIHAFCERLLHTFPFEANVAGHFDVLDERGERALKEEARCAMLGRAAAEPDGAIGRALATVLALVSDVTHEESITAFIDGRDRIGAWIVAKGNLDGAIADLRRALALGRDETVAVLRKRSLAEAPLDAAAARRLVETLAAGTTNDVAAAERLRPYATASDPDLRLEAWLEFFMKDNGEFRVAKSIVTRSVKDSWPGLEELLIAECARLERLVDRLRTAELFESSVAMLRLAEAAIGEYARLKRQRGVLDFEDLVVRTVTLLSRVDASRWVHYKLDRGLDHILVDEAQDTSPRQWQVIKALAEEFFAGEGASRSRRTLFAVGDEKQSIFSFQGAVPAWFALTRQELGSAARAGGYAWADLELHLSFRSAPVVLQAVDEVFKAEVAHRGLAAEARPTVHEARRRNEPGRVVFWPAIEPPEKPKAEDWATPLDHLGKDSPEVRLAKRIATTVRGWLDRGETLDAPDKDGRPRPIHAGGILILTRSRGALTDAINRELKTERVDIAGADRLTLTEHIAVMDLMALGRVVLLPEDDLSLASLLKSPLIGLDEEALFALACERKNRSLWESLTEKAAGREEFARAKALIDAWRAEADWRDPHAFFARILGPDGGRRAFLRRLGPEVDDVLDEFLAQTLAYERNNVPSLEGFLDWLVAGETEIKRDTETLRDEVRVMTVHGAKGLEADVVFLVDNGSRPVIAAHDPRLLSLAADHDPNNPGPFVWMRTIKQMPQMVRTRVEVWRERAAEEYRRLLYVGMTRARDRLYVVGIANQNTDKEMGWHALVSRALQPESTEVRSPAGELEALEWRAAPARLSARTERSPANLAKTALPGWAKEAAPPSPPAVVRVTPSSLSADGDAARFAVRSAFLTRSDPATTLALARGRLAHRLLQSLPDIDPAARGDVGARYLDAMAGGW